MIGVRTNAGQVATELAEVAARLDASIVRTTRDTGALLRTAVQERAPRGPGPKAGRYRRSWRVKFQSSLRGAAVATVGTDEPYGYRLEAGFEGDGFSQPPQPHVEPALAEIGPVFIASIEAMVRHWLPDRAPRR